MNVLFVCTGNTCRSPMAEGLLKKIAEDNDFEMNISSGGMNAKDGSRANKNAVLALEKYGVDISGHTAKNIDAISISEADVILTMTSSHKEMLLYLFGSEAEERMYTLLEYIGLSGDIEDPFGGDIEVYEKCAKKIYDALLDVFKAVRREFDV